MNKTLIVSTVVAVAIGGIVGFSSATSAQEYKHPQFDAVKEVCQKSHDVIDGRWETACGELQDATNTEWLCEELSADAKCWLEQK